MLPKSGRLRACLASVLQPLAHDKGLRFFANLASRRRCSFRDASDSKHGETQRHSTAERNRMAIMHRGKRTAMRREQAEAAP